jgi:hypothetical protein
MEATRLGVEDYYVFLNLGVKLTATACSDCPTAVVGEERMYAYTGPGKFSADSWFEAVKQGHTFITSGPILLLTVESAMPGDEVRVSRGAKLRIHAQAWAPELIGLPKAHGPPLPLTQIRPPLLPGGSSFAILLEPSQFRAGFVVLVVAHVAWPSRSAGRSWEGISKTCTD